MQLPDDVVVVTSENVAEFNARHQAGLAPLQTGNEAGDAGDNAAGNEPTGGSGESEQADGGENDATLDEARNTGNGKPGNSRLQRRFGELAQARNEATQRAETLEQERDRLKAELDAIRGGGTQEQDETQRADNAPRAAKPAPAAPAAAPPTTEAANDGAEPDPEVVKRNWFMRLGVQMQATPDYDEVLNAASDVTIPPQMSNAIMESENGPAIAYYLAKNKAVATRLAGLHEAGMLREIGKLEAQLSQPPADTTDDEGDENPGQQAPARKAAASARRAPPPPPIKPIRANRTSPTDALFDADGEFKGTPEQWREYREKGGG